MRLRALVLAGIALLFGIAALSSHQHKAFPMVIDEAEATTIVCNPAIPIDVRAQRFKGVQKV